MPAKDFNVAIIGGGICGLTLGVTLAREGVKVDIYESASKFGEIGAGIGLGPNSLRTLERLGVLRTILSHSGQGAIDSVWNYFGAGEKGHLHLLHQQEDGLGGKQLPMARYAYLDALVPLIPEHVAHFNKRCTGISQSAGEEKYTIYFADGTENKADIVVGADGIKSIIRYSILEGIPTVRNFGDETTAGVKYGGNLSFTGVRTYRGLIPMDVLKGAGFKMNVDPHAYNLYLGENKYMFAFLIASGKILNVSLNIADKDISDAAPPLTTPWVVESIPNEEVLKHLEGWNEDLRTIMKQMGASNMWALHHINPPLQSYVKGGVVLVGDSVHASTQFLGAGVSQGLDDVVVLKELLTHPETTRSNVHAYDRIRPIHGANIVQKSYAAGKVFLSYPNVTPEKIKEATSDELQKIYEHDIHTDIKSAVRALQVDGVFR